MSLVSYSLPRMTVLRGSISTGQSLKSLPSLDVVAAAALTAVLEVLADIFVSGFVGLFVGMRWVVFGRVSWVALRPGGCGEL